MGLVPAIKSDWLIDWLIKVGRLSYCTPSDLNNYHSYTYYEPYHITRYCIAAKLERSLGFVQSYSMRYKKSVQPSLNTLK